MAYLLRNGVSLYYDVKGDESARETVTLLNGVMASANSWGAYVQPFIDAGYRVLLHDFRGQLGSDKPNDSYSFAMHIEDFRQLIDFLEIERLHLVGTSYGGEIALRAAIDMPVRISSLTIIDSVSETDALLEGYIESWIILADRASRGDAELFYWGVIPSLYSRQFLSKEREAIASRAKQIGKLPPEYFRAQVELYRTFLRDVTMTTELSAIRCPALVVCGEEDILKPPRFSRIIADAIPDSRFALLPGCGHVAVFEAPELLSSMILGFIGSSKS